MNTIDWLLDSDPAIRWQAMRDLTDAAPSAIAADRARVIREGLGSAILAKQESDGSWRREGAPTWLTTLFTLLLLRSTGADSANAAVAKAITRVQSNLRWDCAPGNWDLRPIKDSANPFFEGEVEPCINGGVLTLGGYFGHPNEKLAHRLLGEQLADGGWNCDAPKSNRSSFHTTICVLEGLLEYERALSDSSSDNRVHVNEIAAARHCAEEYFLIRSLFRRRSTGEVANPEFFELAFPPRYHYDVLRALDYFRAAGLHTKTRPDPRLRAAIQLLESKRGAGGAWLLDNSYGEALALPLTETVGQPSRWNTLRALRVLRWYHHN